MVFVLIGSIFSTLSLASNPANLTPSRKSEIPRYMSDAELIDAMLYYELASIASDETPSPLPPPSDSAAAETSHQAVYPFFFNVGASVHAQPLSSPAGFEVPAFIRRGGLPHLHRTRLPASLSHKESLQYLTSENYRNFVDALLPVSAREEGLRLKFAGTKFPPAELLGFLDMRPGPVSLRIRLEVKGPKIVPADLSGYPALQTLVIVDPPGELKGLQTLRGVAHMFLAQVDGKKFPGGILSVREFASEGLRELAISEGTTCSVVLDLRGLERMENLKIARYDKDAGVVKRLSPA